MLPMFMPDDEPMKRETKKKEQKHSEMRVAKYSKFLTVLQPV